MRILHLTMASVLTLCAQQFPDGAALLNQAAGTFKTYDTYQFTVVTTTSGPANTAITATYSGTKTGKLRMEMQMGAIGGTLMVSDGAQAWMYIPALKSYTRFPTDLHAMAAFLAGRNVAQRTDAKVLRSEILEVDGEPHDCWVVENRIPPVAAPLTAAPIKDGIGTYWIDKSSVIVLKTVIVSNMKVPGEGESASLGTTAVLHSIKLNQPLDDSLFVFTPPPDAKETGELFPGVKAMFGNAESAAPVKVAVVPVPAPLVAEPQAYVPNLKPQSRTEAVYPEVARVKNLRGQVEFLLTIDATGSVVRAEPLVGLLLFRQPAIDAVRQWKFRPVIRNGVPVPAYTDASIFFLHSSKPVEPADFQTDIGEEMSASERRASLLKQFPRSPQLVLADLEQDSVNRDASERSFSLPDLAKAALKAEAFEKANAYATELLASPSTDPNYGQAVHDGNMVLGMISLRQGDVRRAKQYLLASGKTPGSPVLDSFGPNMILAKGLLESGERDGVLEYFESCRSFWKLGEKQLETWMEIVRSGGTPSFGANLVY